MRSLKLGSALALEVCLLFVLAGCSSSHTNATSAPPSISIFASPKSINSGGSAVLTVSASNASQVTVAGSDGSSYTISGSGGTQKVSPSSTTTYTATAEGTAGKASAETVVSVESIAAAAPTVAITANPATISAGGSSTLTVTATNATEVTLTGNDGSSYALSVTGGTQSVSPSQTTTYTATVTGAGGSAENSVTLTVTPAAAPTVAISANPSTVESGSASVLTVTVANATQVTVAGTDGSSYALSAAGGTQKVSPSQTTTYTATVTGAGGSAKNSVTLTVTPAPAPTVAISANPSTVESGSASVLTVTAANATQVTVTGTDGSSYALSAAGGTQKVSPSQTTTYTATVTGAGGTANAAATVTAALPASVSMTVNPAVVLAGATSTLTVTADNATAVTVTGTDGTFFTMSPNGGTQTITPSQGTTYTATASGSLGNVTTTAMVQVTPRGGVYAIQHIIFTMQENHSLDQYFGALRDYWAKNGYPDQSFDGLPQFNPVSGAAPLYGPPPTNPGCDPSSPSPSPCVFDPANPVTSYHYPSVCTENPTPGWDEYHIEWDFNDPLGTSPATLNGFAQPAATAARAAGGADVNGAQAMGYYDGDDMNYYYFMASNFATSDRWFQPLLSRTNPSRMYLIAATSQGYVYPTGTNAADQKLLTAPTIFQELQNAGISWKIYVNTDESSCSGPPYDPACLVSLSYLKSFAWGKTFATEYPQNIAPISQYFTDAENGTLPQVAEIEPPFHVPDDEHPGGNNDPQKGAWYESTLVNGLMQSPSWKDSVFILTYDEAGGFYDHVSPQPEPSPDGIKPLDLEPGNECATKTGPICDFVYTGYRIPLLVVSPFTKENYVSHTVADETAILKLIETRFNLPPLTKRDAAQMDMTEFFDFNNPPWLTPPTPPAQNTSGVCNPNLLP